jgi:Tol biopolymer transport system component
VSDDPDVERLTDEVLDGHEPDWDALGRAAEPEGETARRLGSLRIVAGIVAVSRSAQSGAPQEWGGFRLIERIGCGVFGEVWRAYDPQLDREVALKLIPAETDADAQRVLQEGRLLAKVSHPNVATVFGARVEDGDVGMAMEFVRGEDLQSRMGSGPLPVRETLEIGLQLAKALDAVHSAGVLHRDVKAANVKRAIDGRVMLLDFGSGRDIDGEREVHVDATGTPLYLAPEVLRGESASVQSDVYSLGVLLFHLLTGTYPVQGDSIHSIVECHAHRRARPLATVNPAVPRLLASLIDSMLAADACDRPASAAQVAQALAPQLHSPQKTRVIVTAAALILAALWWNGHAYAPPTGVTHGQMAIRLNWPTAPAVIGVPSRDGRTLPFVDRHGGALSLLTVATGTARTLTSETAAEGHARAAAASPDGRRIVYSWYVTSCSCEELRSIDVDARRVTELWRAAPETMIQPSSWAPDGTTIAGTLVYAAGRSDLFTFDAMSGLRLIVRGHASGPSFSSNGRYVAFGNAASDDGHSDIAIADVATGTVTARIDEEWDDRNPIWMGDEVAFVSDRSGKPALWAVSVDSRQGVLSGSPRLVNTGLGEFDLLGAATDGAVFYRQTQGASAVLVGTLDGSSAPRQISAGPGEHVSPDWSPDGHRLAWIDEPPGSPLRHLLHIHDFGGTPDIVLEGIGRDFAQTGMIGMNPRFAPDGRRILVRGAGRGGIRVVDIATRVESPTRLAGRNFGDVEWDLDDEHVFFLDFSRGVMRLDVETGAEEMLYPLPIGASLGRGIAVSPNRQRVAFVLGRGEKGDAATIMLMNRDGSTPQPLRTFKAPHPLFAAPFFAAVPLLLGEWTRDARAVLFAQTETLENGFTRMETGLWSAPVTGESPIRLELSAPGLRDIRPHPDGKRVAYASFDERRETWILGDALGTTSSH